ncbi:hypothetical protein SAMN04489867_0073 [Pedococcus dokdonensis]|uniref:OLD protein-like TOPRIM domain-containing protein n=1 Tax=Pedococcus dokdonensis TaxID=443156 RepID=A0A1H0KQ97_9MICO|nr:TOPRIM nucleotidyl transferase/hydrolase domain-containing protein [Pedococcus dokdonensis]SDO57942.1 hypothetical protein SAMN04489867_0073 [Pedococcus dokdonensis]
MTVSAPLPVPEDATAWVLLEGASDVAAVRTVAHRAGLDLDERGVALVDMHGATNIRRHLLAAHALTDRPRLLGMCDAGEAPFFVRALRRVGCPVEDAGDLPRWGFQVCHRDLEDELVRRLGDDGTRAVLEDLGLTQRFAMLAQQPAWAGGSFHEQVHRFAGTASGRKELMAEALVKPLDPADLPPPLAGLLGSIVQLP